MPAYHDLWRDAHGTPIPNQCRIEQIAVDQILGAAPSPLIVLVRILTTTGIS